MKINIKPLSTASRDYLETRGIMPEAVAQLGHLVATQVGEHGEEALAFRHHVDGRDHKDHFHFRALGSKRFFQSKGTRRRLWNNECLANNPETVLITEGHIDAITLMAIGYINTMSVPDGAPDDEIETPVTKYDYLKPVDWTAIKTVILAVDSDVPGQLLRDDLALRIGRSRCKFVRWPRGCKDANDTLMAHGHEAVTSAIAAASYVPLSGLLKLSQIPERAPEQPWSFGIEGLDDLYRPAAGRMAILTGIPGHGKSTLITDMVVAFVEKNRLPVAIASFEDDIRISLVPRIIERLVGKPIEQCTISEEMQAEEWIERNIRFIQQPDDDGEEEQADVNWVIERIAAAAMRNNCRFIIVDPWNEIDHTTRPADVPVTEYTGVMLKKLRNAAKTYKFHLLLAAHPRKMHKGADGNYSMPSGYDISDSAHWVNKPDNGLTIHRGEGNRVTVNSWKCRRDGVIGTLGKRCFIYDKLARCFKFDQVETFRPMA